MIPGKLLASFIFLVLSAILLLVSPSCHHHARHAKTPELATGDHWAVINGKKLKYHVAGCGPVCIVQPGGPGLDWSYMRMPDLEKFLTVVYLQPVGSADSDRLAGPADYTKRRFADDIEGLRQSLGLEKIYLIGHSYGGMVAQVYAIDHSDKLNGLILHSTSPTTGKGWFEDVGANMKWFEKEPWFPTAAQAFADAPKMKTDDEYAEGWKKVIGLYVYDYGSTKDKYDRLLGSMQFSVAPFQGYLAEMADYDLRDRLENIQAPCLVIAGRKDFVFSVKYAEALRDGIPGARLTVLEKSGHMGHIEEPKAFNAAVKEFVSGGKKKR
ncbi:MAG: alpha/beta hydrolase [Nitrospinae bacterium]|nr:alpha/beta hydrolase [Nitrospinota bacterium]MBF0633664.1 alpha/beta hydrolase [Nitrospinota bacterium]